MGDGNELFRNMSMCIKWGSLYQEARWCEMYHPQHSLGESIRLPFILYRSFSQLV